MISAKMLESDNGMDVKTALQQRRAIKNFDPNFVIPDSDMRALMEAVLYAPTSFNIQNWRFVVVTDMGIKQQLRAAAWDQAQVTDASAMIVLCADVKAWEKEPQRYWRNAPQDVQNLLLPMIDQFYRGKDQLQRDEAMRSCGMAAQSLMLMAVTMGYDTCPMVGFDPTRVAHIIQLPGDHVIGLMIAIGKKTKDAQPRGGQLAYDELVFANRFL